jgi:hypothetical protein
VYAFSWSDTLTGQLCAGASIVCAMLIAILIPPTGWALLQFWYYSWMPVFLHPVGGDKPEYWERRFAKQLKGEEEWIEFLSNREQANTTILEDRRAEYSYLARRYRLKRMDLESYRSQQALDAKWTLEKLGIPLFLLILLEGFLVLSLYVLFG